MLPRPTQQRASSMGLSAPVQGIVASSAYEPDFGVGDARAALYVYNMICGEYGARVRPGTREYAINLLDKTGAFGDVRTLMYYNSVQAGGATDRFFATTDLGIYDITGGTNIVLNGDWLYREDHLTPILEGQWHYDGANLIFANTDGNGIDFAAALAGIAIGDWFYMRGPLSSNAIYRATAGPVPGVDPNTTSIAVVVVDASTMTPDENALCSFGIYNEAELVLTWPNQSDDAGWVSFVNYTNVAGDHYLLACDEANGYYIFDGTSWDQGSFVGGSNPAPEDMAHITEWQGRIWFTERNSANAWYLPVLEFDSANPEPVDFGSRFISGGHLVMLSTWTLDAGDGMDDKLVAISSSGDVLTIGSASDFASGAFIIEGRWQIGKVPEGRRVMSELGGDILILTAFGVVRLSDIVRGLIVEDESKLATRNIARYMRESMQDTIDLYGWSIDKNSVAGIMIISVPQSQLQQSDPMVQYVMDLNTQAWSIFRGPRMRCMNENNEGFFYGSDRGKVVRMVGTVDNATLDGLSSEGIKFSLLTHYTNFGQPANWKQAQFVRPWWIGDADPAYLTKVMYDFSISEIEGSPVFTGSNIALWDNAIWDIDTWATTAQNYFETVGAKNMGRHLALAIKGETSVTTSYLGADIIITQGGML